MKHYTKGMPMENELKKISAWSFSRLSKFEQCPYSVYLASIAKEPGPEKDPDKESAADRGSRIHEEAENFVQGITSDLPSTLSKPKIKQGLEMLKEMYSEGILEIEQDWGFTIDWESCGFFDDNVWLRVKCDVVIHHDKDTATVIDYKTGKSWGNEVKHMQQGQLYAIASFMKYPDLEDIDVEFWYTDEDKITKKRYTRSKMTQKIKKFHERGLRVTTTVIFNAKPNIHNCRWCDYGPNKGTGVCAYGVEP